MAVLCLCFFFFKQKTAYERRISDWSSDVCSSDLVLTNWGGLLTWFNAVPNPIYPLIAGDLLPGQSEDDLPRTRRCVFDTSRQTGVIPEEVSNPDFELPEFVDEVLIAADQNAYFLAYKYSDNFHPGMTQMQMIEKSETRRVGKEMCSRGRVRWSPFHRNKKYNNQKAAN